MLSIDSSIEILASLEALVGRKRATTELVVDSGIIEVTEEEVDRELMKVSRREVTEERVG
jgi:hypothetical protein